MVALGAAGIVNRERVSQAVRCQVRAEHAKERLGGLSVQEVEQVPKKANVEFSPGWNRQEFFKLVVQRRCIFGGDYGQLRKQVNEVQPAAVIGKEVHRIG